MIKKLKNSSVAIKSLLIGGCLANIMFCLELELYGIVMLVAMVIFLLWTSRNKG